MNLYQGLDAEQLEREYNLRALRPDFDDLMARWSERSAPRREASNARVDIAYGEGERDKLDFFHGGDRQGLVVVYIHGGYWQRSDKTLHSFLSEPFVSHGVSMAVLNYDLTPAVRMPQIPPQIRKAVAWLWNASSELGFAREKLHLMGHSAGGHLTAMMMATDWPAVGKDLPSDLIKSAIPISGVYELEPLVHTSINAIPQMDVAEAVAESPAFIPPLTDAPQLLVVGEAETREFHRQSDDYRAKFRTEARKMERYDVPGADHFDVLERLADSDSVFFQKSLALISD